ncbi:hypothetical protein URH17368_0843 [Alicyclobacillus hesperidum URH17-3-68]|nr:hypothetical protein URH17368_0843 [Alicyclobacillus hesperidum URH17-3-68]
MGICHNQQECLLYRAKFGCTNANANKFNKEARTWTHPTGLKRCNSNHTRKGVFIAKPTIRLCGWKTNRHWVTTAPRDAAPHLSIFYCVRKTSPTSTGSSRTNFGIFTWAIRSSFTPLMLPGNTRHTRSACAWMLVNDHSYSCQRGPSLVRRPPRKSPINTCSVTRLSVVWSHQALITGTLSYVNGMNSSRSFHSMRQSSSDWRSFKQLFHAHMQDPRIVKRFLTYGAIAKFVVKRFCMALGIEDGAVVSICQRKFLDGRHNSPTKATFAIGLKHCNSLNFCCSITFIAIRLIASRGDGSSLVVFDIDVMPHSDDILFVDFFFHRHLLLFDEHLSPNIQASL